MIRILGATALLLASLATPAHAIDGLEFQTVTAPDGVPLVVATGGDPNGPPILFIHGFGQGLQSFAANFTSPALQRFRLVALDLRGHAGSGKPWRPEDYASDKIWADDIQAVIAATKIERPVLVGWSFGGFVLVDFLEHYGADAASGAILVGSGGGLPGAPTPAANAEPPKDEAAAAQLREVARMGQMASSLDTTQNIAGAKVFARFLTAEPRDQAWTDSTASLVAMMPSYARRAMMGRNLDNRAMIPKMTLPVHFLVGEKDGSAPPALLQPLIEQLPDADITIYPGFGHSPFIENQAVFEADLAAFVDRVTSR